ncbi:glycosyltransferase family 4 protein [Acetonema longum]|uniref:Glycosyl transferase group 1 n=1 Tax=Acetonema longum DSM 6540 TaxID=1009370 RepID=F7NIB8_9FIRM|nr:glycosyltransferase family 1 protein [Acetonema longum]EGO64224.1 glycosyl transferase group 1 [Acetonema longum DSM 6540]
MRIALFTDTFTPQINGVSRTYQRLVSYLQSQGIETMVLAPSGNGPDGEQQGVIRFLSCDFFLYPECQIAWPNYFSLCSALDRFRPDLVHIATPFVLGLAGLKYADSRGLPKVAVFHTNFPQYLDYYRMPLLKKLAWRFLRWFHTQADRNYCPSQETRRLLARHGIPRVDLWSRGVDHTLFNPMWHSGDLRRLHGVGDKTVLLYVGRLAPEKNVEILLQALTAANASINGLHLWIVGDGPARPALEAMAPANVTFMGYRAGQDLAGLYASADIFVCPSVTETFGNVILEAMASGLPVVAPMAGGIKENLFPMKTGLDCLPLNSLSMAEAIIRLARDRELRISLAAQAFQHASEQTWEMVFGRLVDSYRDVIERHRSTRRIQAI